MAGLHIPEGYKLGCPWKCWWEGGHSRDGATQLHLLLKEEQSISKRHFRPGPQGLETLLRTGQKTGAEFFKSF